MDRLNSFAWMMAFIWLLLPGKRILAEGSAESFLRNNDQILIIGDSVTARGIFTAQLHHALDAAYPGHAIKLINWGVGGNKAEDGYNIFSQYVANHEAPTIAIVMLGINDTRLWDDDADAKIAHFSEWMEKFPVLAREHNVELIFLTSTSISMDRKPREWATRINGMLDRLIAAQRAIANRHNVPLIDINAIYKDRLASAWRVDPAYNFSPDGVHPLSAGHAVVSGELLCAFGVGLPLSTDTARGPLYVAHDSNIALTIEPMAAVLDTGEPLAVHLQLANSSQSPRSGRVIVIADRRYDIGEMTLAGDESRSIYLPIPQADLLSPSATRPLYIAWMSDDRFTAAHTLFHHSTVQLSGDESVAFTPDQFRKLDKFSLECPVSDVSVQFHEQAIDIDFRWKDQTPVPANGAFDAFKLSSRTRVTLKGPIDLESSPTWQACDSVEFFIDTRLPDSHGRDTSPADGNPEDVMRIGIYYELVNNEPVARLMLPVAISSRDAKLQALGDNRYRLTVEMATIPDMLGFSARVTDLDSFRAESMRVFTLSPDDDLMQSQYFTPGFTSQLTGYLDFFRLSRETSGVFYRIGY